MKKLAHALIASTAILVAVGAHAAKDYVILEVGDKQIKTSEVETIWQGLFPTGAAPGFDSVEEPIKQNILRGVVSEYLLYDEAIEAGADKNPDVQAEVQEAKRKITVRHFIESKTTNLLSEKDIRDEYDSLKKKNRNKEEVRARHILVETEDEAKELKKKLDDGADFEKLAAELSKDSGSKAQGGDLGFFAEGQMVKSFSDAAFALKKGEISDPVESSFGWHIIRTEERRKLKMPSYSDMKDSIKSRLTEERLNEYVNRLVDQTAVKYFGPNGKEKDFTKVPDSTKEKKN